MQQEQKEKEKWAKYGNMAKQKTETIKEKDGRRTNKQEGPSVRNTYSKCMRRGIKGKADLHTQNSKTGMF